MNAAAEPSFDRLYLRRVAIRPGCVHITLDGLGADDAGREGFRDVHMQFLGVDKVSLHGDYEPGTKMASQTSFSVGESTRVKAYSLDLVGGRITVMAVKCNIVSHITLPHEI